ncbi:MAG: hypothetical protein AAGF26_01555 [Cyanobacteria bacterium P01_G01_bin.49]
MDYCYVEFVPKDTESLYRTIELFGMVKAAKEANEAVNEKPLVDYLSDVERAYFWNPSPEESKEWHDQWFSTPLEIRHSRKMLTPQWHLESMLDAFWNGDYDLVAIQEENGKHYLTFYPYGYPYGGTGCMVAFLECFGHRIVGIDDGTGYDKYVPQAEFWKPKKKQG